MNYSTFILKMGNAAGLAGMCIAIFFVIAYGIMEMSGPSVISGDQKYKIWRLIILLTFIIVMVALILAHTQ